MNDDWKFADKREYRRTPSKDPLVEAGKFALRVAGQAHPVLKIVDVTPAGMGLYTSASLATGREVDIAIDVKGSPQSICGTVSWCKPVAGAGDAVYRIGIRFDERHLTKNLNFFVALSKINIDLK